MRDKARDQFSAMDQHSSDRPKNVDGGGEAESRARSPLHHQMGNGAIQLMSRRAMNQHRSTEQKVTDEEVRAVMAQEDGRPRDREAEASADAEPGNILSVIAEEREARY